MTAYISKTWTILLLALMSPISFSTGKCIKCTRLSPYCMFGGNGSPFGQRERAWVGGLVGGSVESRAVYRANPEIFEACVTPNV